MLERSQRCERGHGEAHFFLSRALSLHNSVEAAYHGEYRTPAICICIRGLLKSTERLRKLATIRYGAFMNGAKFRAPRYTRAAPPPPSSRALDTCWITKHESRTRTSFAESRRIASSRTESRRERPIVIADCDRVRIAGYEKSAKMTTRSIRGNWKSHAEHVARVRTDRRSTPRFLCKCCKRARAFRCRQSCSTTKAPIHCTANPG